MLARVFNMALKYFDHHREHALGWLKASQSRSRRRNAACTRRYIHRHGGCNRPHRSHGARNTDMNATRAVTVFGSACGPAQLVVRATTARGRYRSRRRLFHEGLANRQVRACAQRQGHAERRRRLQVRRPVESQGDPRRVLQRELVAGSTGSPRQSRQPIDVPKPPYPGPSTFPMTAITRGFRSPLATPDRSVPKCFGRTWRSWHQARSTRWKATS